MAKSDKLPPSHQPDQASEIAMRPVTEKISEAPTHGKEQFATGGRLMLIMCAVLLVMFLVALDRTIIATAVPRIANEFHALDDISWYASAYLLTSCATQLLWGRLYTFYSTKAVFLIAILIFEVGSALCGGAPSSNVFIVGRAIAGIGSAGIFSGTTVIVAQIVPLQKRPMYVGLMGSMFGISSIIGPLMGGAFTDQVTWRWCFYINLPIGGATLLALVLFLHVPHKAEPYLLSRQLIRLDPLGTALFLPGVICFLLALQWGGVTYPWNNGRIISLFVVACILLIAFVAVQIWRQEDATIPPRIFNQRSIISGTVFALCLGGGLISMLYTLPLWFQAVKNVSAVKSGIDTIPMVLSLVVASILSGGIITATGYYVPWMYVATVLMSVGAGMTTTFKVDTGHAAWIGYQVLFGLGLGSGLQQPSLAAQTVLGEKDVPIGISLMFFSQSLGGAIFICIAQALFTNYLSARLVGIPGVDPGVILSAGATELSKVVPSGMLDAVSVVYNEGLKRSFTVTVAVACLMVLPALAMEWRTVKKGKEEVSAA
ncbi:hypothetical protein BBP40_010981 [Aspergillus hancockii]|nr:hypothetical protein BBP40_010981 [Aspergillus hancockii]